MHMKSNGRMTAHMAGLWGLFCIGSALVFFWPSHTIANIDDLFFVPWATEYAATGEHINPLLAIQFPGLENYHLYTRFHLILSGLFLELFGVSRLTVIAYEYACFLSTALAFSGLCLAIRLPKAAIMAPLLFAPMYVVAGFRLETTACIFWMFGLFMLFLAARLQDLGETELRVSGVRTLGKFMLAFAPLASPAVFAWSLGAILAHDLWQLYSRKLGFGRFVLENGIALLLGLLVFSLSIEFQYRDFFDQLVFHAARSTGHGINDEALLRAGIFAATGLILTRWSRAAALLCLMLAAGQGLGAFLHDKALARNLAASAVFLVALDAVTAKRFQALAYGIYGLVILVVSANFLLFYLLSGTAPGRDLALKDYQHDVAAHKRVFIDETMAHHYLDHQTRDAIAWTWGRKFPLARAEKLSELNPGEVWYLSPYTLFGYLKGHTAIADAVKAGGISYRHTPQLPCVMGRQSCRLPAEGWTMLRLERTGGSVQLKDYSTGRTIQLPEGS